MNAPENASGAVGNGTETVAPDVDAAVKGDLVPKRKRKGGGHGPTKAELQAQVNDLKRLAEHRWGELLTEREKRFKEAHAATHFADEAVTVEAAKREEA